MPQRIDLQNIVLEADRRLVNGLSLTLRRGRVLALVGASGSGKSLTCAATLGVLPAGVRHHMNNRTQLALALSPSASAQQHRQTAH